MWIGDKKKIGLYLKVTVIKIKFNINTVIQIVCLFYAYVHTKMFIASNALIITSA